MSLIKSQDGKKWINGFIVVSSGLVGYVFIQFLLGPVRDWFDLEARIPFDYDLLASLFGVVAGVLTFLLIQKNKAASTHLNEVYSELVKVVWPEKNLVLKVTIGIIIGLAFVSLILLGVDYACRTILGFLY
jgi:preprotein translocase subunit SecE